LFGVAATALRRPPDIDSRALAALVGGLALLFVADVGYGQLNLIGAFDLERWPDIVYASSTLLIALAGYFQAHPGAATEGQVTALSRWLIVLPYAGLAAGYSVVIALAISSATGELTEVLFAAVALTAMVLIRQELVLRENSRLLAEQARRESEERFSALAANSSDAVVLVDRDGVVTDATPAVVRILGLDSSQLVGRPISRLVHGDDAERIQTFIADVGGRAIRHPASRVAPVGCDRHLASGRDDCRNLLDDPSVGQIVLTTRDVRERKTLEKQLTQVALHDLLTNLPNRTLFRDRVGRRLQEPAAPTGHDCPFARPGRLQARVNESLGHAVGDQVLQKVSRRLLASARAADTCARLGGTSLGSCSMAT